MKKKLLLALLSATMVTSAFSGDWSTIKIGTEGAYPPWNGTNAAGELEGAEIDLAMDLCERMNATCILVAQDWDGIIPALQNGKYDAIIAGMSITSERLEVIDFSQGYATEPATFSTQSSSALASTGTSGPLNLDLASSAGGLAELKSLLDGAVIGVQGSTTHENFVRQELGDSVTIKTYDTQQNLELDLLAGRLNAALSDSGSMEEFMESNPGLAFFGPKLGGANSVQALVLVCVNQIPTSRQCLTRQLTKLELMVHWQPTSSSGLEKISQCKIVLSVYKKRSSILTAFFCM